MAKSNGGIIGVVNQASFGKCIVTSQTSSGSLTTQPGTRQVQTLVVAGGGGGGRANGGGGGAGGFRCVQINVCGAKTYPITVGAGGVGGGAPSPSVSGNPSIFSTITSSGGGAGTGGSRL
jgi:hypothetical protein